MENIEQATAAPGEVRNVTELRAPCPTTGVKHRLDFDEVEAAGDSIHVTLKTVICVECRKVWAVSDLP